MSGSWGSDENVLASVGQASTLFAMLPAVAQNAMTNFDEYLTLISVMERSPRRHVARNVALVEVLRHTGLGLDDLVSLDTTQIDFERRVLLDARGEAGERVSEPFSDLVSDALERCLAKRFLLQPKPGMQALFVSRRGGRLSARSVQALIRRAAEEAGLQARLRPAAPR